MPSGRECWWRWCEACACVYVYAVNAYAIVFRAKRRRWAITWSSSSEWRFVCYSIFYSRRPKSFDKFTRGQTRDRLTWASRTLDQRTSAVVSEFSRMSSPWLSLQSAVVTDRRGSRSHTAHTRATEFVPVTLRPVADH